MSQPTDDRMGPWWHRRGPSLLVFTLVLVVMTVAAVLMSRQVVEVIGEVPKDELGEDNWTDQLGIESGAGLTLAQLPECAADPITRIVLWDADSNPYWEVVGPPTPFMAFMVGAVPAGFTEVVPYRIPDDDELLRLVVFRRVGGVAGMRFRIIDLVDGKVISGLPIRTYTREGFRKEKVCGTPTKLDVAIDDTADDGHGVDSIQPEAGGETITVPD